MVYCLFIRQGQKVKKKSRRLFIVSLSGRAWKVKRGQKLLLFIYPPGQFKRQAESCLLFIVYLSGRVRKFKRKAKSGIMFVYQAGLEN